jgi:tetratricopeptide (TPR) repeat protein
MKYFDGLFSPEEKVLPNYFKVGVGKKTTKLKLLDMLSYMGAAFFFLSSLAYVVHPSVALLFALIGFSILPYGHRSIEKQLRFKFTTAIKTIFCLILFISTIPLIARYSEEDAMAEAAKLRSLKLEAVAAEVKLKQEENRKLQFNSLLEKAQAASQTKNSDVSSLLDSLQSAAKSDDEHSEVYELRLVVNSLRAKALIASGNYKAALPLIQELIETSGSTTERLYQRALCYSKTGDVPAAVADLKKCMAEDYKPADRLHERINPLRKRITGYITLCRDGTTSYATGRGACSWHGGVAQWNYPKYETYRKYE